MRDLAWLLSSVVVVALAGRLASHLACPVPPAASSSELDPAGLIDLRDPRAPIDVGGVGLGWSPQRVLEALGPPSRRFRHLGEEVWAYAPSPPGSSTLPVSQVHFAVSQAQQPDTVVHVQGGFARQRGIVFARTGELVASLPASLQTAIAAGCLRLEVVAGTRLELGVTDDRSHERTLAAVRLSRACQHAGYTP